MQPCADGVDEEGPFHLQPAANVRMKFDTRVLVSQRL